MLNNDLELKKQLKVRNFEKIESILLSSKKYAAKYILFLYVTGRLEKCLKVIASSEIFLKRFAYLKNRIEKQYFLSKDYHNQKSLEVAYYINDLISKDIIDWNKVYNLIKRINCGIDRISFTEEYIFFIVSEKIKYELENKNKNFENLDMLNVFRYLSHPRFYKPYAQYVYSLGEIFQDCFKKPINENKKIAVCFHGVLRGNWKDIFQENIRKISQFYEIDCFLFAWDEKQVWPGVRPNWLVRFFSNEKWKNLDSLNDMNFFKEKYPNLYNKLKCEYFSKLTFDEKKDLSNIFKNFILQDQNSFTIPSQYAAYTAYLYYYGKYMAFQAMKRYEQENNFNYKYVLVLRSDCIIECQNNCFDLKKINNGCIYDRVFGLGVATDYMFGCRNDIECVVSMFENISQISNNSLYNILNTHDTYYKWMLRNNIKIIPSNGFDISFWGNDKISKSFLIPNIKKEVSEYLQYKADDKCIIFLKKFLSNMKEMKYVSGFIDRDSRVYYPYNDFFQTKYGTAKTRIHNHLSYKLGQAMIENSKSLLGYIRMPFVLSYIKDKHKQEQKNYQEKIKKDPSLALPPLEDYPDYKEALKEKECLTYKLGQALIQANKTWYGGGGGISSCCLKLGS